MDSDLLKNSKKVGAIFLATILISFLSLMIINSQETFELGNISKSLFFLFLFFLIIFHFLFKYQKEVYHKKSMFWKIPLIAIAIWILGMALLFIQASSKYSDPGWALWAIIMIGLIGAVIIVVFSLILVVNSWFRTNLFIVAWTIFVFVTIGSLFKESAFYIFSFPIGSLVGTLLAIYFKKHPWKLKEPQKEIFNEE
ncbi:MAG: hypothetical protein ISS25_03050 [Nanoarchaeota archaeon]|nr:hypothetical protein [DPANN group archaeon]MBL7116778.1 hypothetical protein [Nanoarchaeota archaeon]